MSSSVPPPPLDYRTQRRLRADQARFAKQRQRAERAQMKMRARATRRRSAAGPLLILGLGLVFLLIQTGRFSWSQALHWYVRWWPTVLIAVGLLMLLEWALDARRGDALRSRTPGPGIVALLLVLLAGGVLVRAASTEWMSDETGWSDRWQGLARLAGQERTFDSTLSAALPSGGTLIIRDPHGDVTVSGTSTDGQVHVSVESQVYAWNNSAANRDEQIIRPRFSQAGSGLILESQRADGGNVDLTVQAPRNAIVSVESGDGDTELDGLQGQVAVSANRGDINLNQLGGPVSTRVHNDNASVTAHNIQGSVSVEGRVGDINLSDVNGAVILHGDFFGETHLEHIAGPTRFESSRTQLQCGRIGEELEIDGGAELQGAALAGPILLKTSNRNITLDRVMGSVQIRNRNGSVSLTSVAPIAAVQVVDEHGSIDVGLPANQGFTLSAQTRNGDVENDFALAAEGPKEDRRLQGSVAGGGPAVSLTTSDGDVVVRKSTATLPRADSVPAPQKRKNSPAPQEESF